MSPTPAPWHLDVQADGGKRRYRLCGPKSPIHRRHIATLNEYGDPLGDGALMVAAPALLDYAERQAYGNVTEALDALDRGDLGQVRLVLQSILEEAQEAIQAVNGVKE